MKSPLRGVLAAPYLAAMIILTVACAPVASTPTATTQPPTKPTAPAASTAKPAAASPAAATKAATTSTISVAVIGVASDSAIYIAQERGFFQEQGIQVTLQTFQSSSETIPLLASRQLDVGSGSPSAGLFNAIQRDIPLRIVADKSTSDTGKSSLALVVRKDLVDSGAVKSLIDLKGKKIAMPAKGSSSDYMLDMELHKEGLSLKDIDLVTMSFPEINVALKNQSIEAAVTLEPTLGIAERQGLLVPFKWEDDMVHNHSAAILVYSPSFVTDRPEMGKRFMVAYLKGLRIYYDSFTREKGNGRAEIIPTLINNTNIKDEQTYRLMRVSSVDPNGYPNKVSLKAEQDWYAEAGYVQQKIDLDKVIDTQFIDYAVSVLGKYKD